MSCFLRISGPGFDPDDFSKSCGIPPYRIARKGELKFPSSPRITSTHDVSGCHYEVSDAEFEEFETQIQDAIQFLKSNAAALACIQDRTDIQYAALDFGIELRDVAVQCDYIPPELLFLAGSLGLGIELSHYPISTETEQPPA
jgi:hypothetical protein